MVIHSEFVLTLLLADETFMGNKSKEHSINLVLLNLDLRRLAYSVSMNYVSKALGMIVSFSPNVFASGSFL